MRRPLALIGALSLLSLVSDLLHLQENLRDWIQAWQSVSRTVMSALFGWLFEWVNIELTSKIKDYISSSIVFAGMTFRAQLYEKKYINPNINNGEIYLNTIILGAGWPALLMIGIGFYIINVLGIVKIEESEKKEIDSIVFVFLESFLYAAIIIAASYALLYAS